MILAVDAGEVPPPSCDSLHTLRLLALLLDPARARWGYIDPCDDVLIHPELHRVLRPLIRVVCLSRGA